MNTKSWQFKIKSTVRRTSKNVIAMARSLSLERFRTSKGSSLSGRLRGIILHVVFSFRSHPGTNPHASHGKHLSRSRQDYSDVFFSISSIASTECAYAPPARISAATQIASISSFSVAPCRKAAFV